ncbi:MULTISPECIES: CdaR family transcriptional regulator [Nocardia]|uniref:PucR family transcriptional regulator n=1 Tax=Nocardia TaxID=1817 RepID=UPI0009EE74FD|nr:MULTISPECIES: helix-turn-helix domain-containing protein [Nocardia]MBV7707970.1 helix-turn-helix domain-containing protein [Nocardia nova]
MTPSAPSLAATLTRSVRTDAPAPHSDTSAEFGAGVRECLALAADMVAEPDPEPADAARLAELVGRAGAWAREGIDLDTVLRAYHEAVRRAFSDIAGGRGDGETLFADAEQALRLLETVTVATSAAYLDEHRSAARHHQTAAQTLVTALLSGHGRAALARRTGIAVAPAYQVVALSIAPHPGESDPRRNAETVARRKLRRLQSALAPVLGSRALSLLSVDGGTVLVPVDDPDATARIDAPVLTADTLDVLSAAASVPLTATVVAGPTARIPELAAQAHELLELVRALGRPPGLYEIADVAVEYQLTRPGPARAHLAAVLGPLRPHPDLLETLRAYVDSGLDRKSTAVRLAIHPNSVAHRVRRIERLTGIELARPDGLARASLALLAFDLATDSRTEEYA